MKKFIRKNRDHILVIIAALILVVTIICATYAYYYFNVDKKSVSTKVNTTSECFSLTFTNSGSLILSGETSAPMHDKKALTSDTYKDDYRKTVTITNNCADARSISLAIIVDSKSTISENAIKYAVYGETETIPTTGIYLSSKKHYDLSASSIYDLTHTSDSISNMTFTQGIPIKNVRVEGNSSKTFYVAMWVDYYEGNTDGSLNNSTVDKNFVSSVVLLPISYTSASNELASLAQDTLADGASGLLKDETYGDRFVGASPNNYVYFNCDDYDAPTSDTCELWRIIGIENINNKNLIKLIRSDKIKDSFYYDRKEYGVGTRTAPFKSEPESAAWWDSQLMFLLNPDSAVPSGYTIDGTSVYDTNNKLVFAYSGAYYYSQVYSNGYGGTNDYSEYGLKTSRTEVTATDQMIQEVTINNPYCYSSSISTIDDFYNCEHNSTEKSWTGKVVLPYATDALLAGTNTSLTDRQTCIASGTSSIYGSTNCYKTNNWFKQTILIDNEYSDNNAYSGNENYYYYSGSYFNILTASNNQEFRPVIYLNKNVYFTGGNGSSDTPYTINY